MAKNTELRVSFERLADKDTTEESTDIDKGKISLPIAGEIKFENIEFRFQPGTQHSQKYQS